MASARVVSLSIVNALFSVFGCVMNILVLLAIHQNADLQKGLNLLIVSLTVADLINCLIAQPMYVYYLSNDENNSYCVAFEIIAFIGLHAVFSNLVTITYHRSKALSRPFSHLLLVSRKNILVFIVLTWVASIIIGVVFATEPGKVASAYVHAVMIMCLVLVYIRILWVSRRKRAKIAEQPGTASYHQQAATMEHENAAAITSAILVGLTLLCFLPDVLLDLMGEGEVNRRLWTYTLLFSSSALNPCIVIWRNQQFRRALLQTLRGSQ
ncbi:histamine H2 receptor-like [Oculina patagonica]